MPGMAEEAGMKRVGGGHNQAPSVKICGVAGLEMAREIVGAGPDCIGFVFAPSRRRVSPADVRGWLARLEEEGAKLPLTVGVFARPRREDVDAVLTEAPLDAVQLIAGHDPDLPAWLKGRHKVQVWLTVPIAGAEPGGNRMAEGEAMLRRMRHSIDAILLDTHDPSQGGGSGRTFDWTVIPGYRSLAEELGLPLYAAGGLSPDNVGRLLAGGRLDGVDVSSGVETEGVKDIRKVTAFIERVRAYGTDTDEENGGGAA
ncbi:MAG: phosphoribosylanthranilate isomerase [Paenibacillus dendritiformis]|uniref:phosphoribosylanthranilate isomerase n=1 Tax=Paenibacillus dendritiformis TaxID=130049 RepID=UPI00143D6153|nr:phosphoribosylanthranilate isomerase [Paenibacillus dendritiformis]MDU5140582.1 phosphoribosylanthranilate isomerase [Paenibacillus dendritiformis]NKI23341.1 phosphoribosylanthranilate isomerase [Paenibacillus dendritiformis]NRF98399.1 phosphoribosylanthranilate isomerase [Paenibacillus dendritiformis]